jgi:hypothetical protein
VLFRSEKEEVLNKVKEGKGRSIKN